MECSKCGEVYKDEYMIFEDGLSICKGCYSLVEDKDTVCDDCLYFYVDDSVLNDYPSCRNRECSYYDETNYYIPVMVKKDCKYYQGHSN